MFEPTAGPSTSRIPKISGTTPGLLDPTQSERLLRLPGSKLFFAAFDPLTASAQEDVLDMRKLSLKDELYRPKRVVIEIAPNGESFWRFVPSARRDETAVDEGQWPRVVELCSELVECSQDQWDVYKLDPAYDCYVKSYPNLTVISRRALYKHPQTFLGSKRPTVTPPSETTTPPLNSRKKRQDEWRSGSSGEDYGEENEVEDMVIDDGPTLVRPRRHGGGLRDEMEKNRRDRREKLARRANRLSKQEDEEILFNFQPNAAPPSNEAAGKRKVNALFDSLRSHGEHDHIRPTDEDLRNTVNYAQAKQSKRTRTVSPASTKRDLETKRQEREKQRRDRREKELNVRRQQRDAKFLNEIYSEIIPDTRLEEEANMGTQELGEDEGGDLPPVESLCEEDARQAAIQESRRKLAELEADRPLWEQEAKKRMARERLEEEARRAAAEARRSAAKAQEEAERRAKVQREEHEATERERELRQKKEKMAQREKERRQQNQRWLHGPWTDRRALERYKMLSDTFDTTKFSADEPLTADAVPWPVLQSPATFAVEDVDWATVERFFEVAKAHMRSQDYRPFVERSHRRFHPDRWRSRSLLKNVVDDAERGCMEVAANTVAQALTPIWQELTGRG